jgi:TRAP-type transport system small permease protein
MAKLDRALTWLLDAICIVLTAGLFALIATVVVTRLTGMGSPAWSDEIVEFMLAWLIFLGAAALWRRGEHFRVDLLEQTIESKQIRLGLAIVVELLCISFLAVLTYYGSTFAWLATDTSPTFSLPRIFWHAAMPVSSGLMLIHSLRRVSRLLRGVEIPNGPMSSSGLN